MFHSVHLTPVGIDELPTAGHPLTTSLWASIKHKNGWTAHPFFIPSSEKHILVLSKQILFFSIGYVPYTDFEEVSQDLMLKITDEVKQLTRLPFLFIRYEFAYGLKRTGSWSHRRVHSCPFPIQPASSVLIHLNADYETVCSHYTKRARRALRKSRQADSDTILSDKQASHIDRWMALYQETAARDGFYARSREYIENVLSHQGVHLFLAIYEEKIVGGVITVESDTHILYLFGATARNLPFPPGYQLQDAVIRYACDNDRAVYDLHGIGTEDDHLSSLTLFKTSFGGEVVRRETGVDVVRHPLAYSLYRAAEWIMLTHARKRR
ncbi:MAG: peptidoglycan bridge formation glycyltransferase FemA/FemB family protein [Sphaerochaetaceae bacterium]|nr:peptidoglycan bridge formation glycyltransferase FemA/FemB family protein [Sphaerochaetaceae bacterium]